MRCIAAAGTAPTPGSATAIAADATRAPAPLRQRARLMVKSKSLRSREFPLAKFSNLADCARIRGIKGSTNSATRRQERRHRSSGLGAERRWRSSSRTVLRQVPARISRFSMSGYDFRSPRLYVDAPLDGAPRSRSTGPRRTISATVLRLRPAIASSSSMAATASGARRSTAQQARGDAARRRPDAAADRAADLHYLFAPLKAARLDYMVQKAVEMGAVAAAAGADPPRPGAARQSRRGCGPTPSRPPSNAASWRCRRSRRR